MRIKPIYIYIWELNIYIYMGIKPDPLTNFIT